jgi:prevent-host-death family protein
MNTVKIADLKSRLSEHLRKVRAGRSMTILDRDHPIARLVPIEKTGGLNRSPASRLGSEAPARAVASAAAPPQV